MVKLNLGGGRHWKMDGWDNLDKNHGYDLVKLGLSPYNDNSVHLVYSSHNLEHIPLLQVPKYLSEIYRVLMPGGTVRIVVPDVDLLWSFLETNNKEILMSARYYNREGRDTRPLLEDIRELFGLSTDGLIFLKGQHKGYYTLSSLGILLYSAGFNNVTKKEQNDSNIPDFCVPSVNGKDAIFTSGFDNEEHAMMSLYVESVK